jgi:hypothetical protein
VRLRRANSYWRGGRGADEAAFGEALHEPVVEGALVFEFEGADAVGDLFERVFDGVGEGVHRVDAPGVAGVVVGGAADAVEGRVAQVDVGRGHVDLGAQHGRAVGHARRRASRGSGRGCPRGRGSRKGLLDAGFAEVAAVDAHLLGALLVHVGQAGLDEVLGGAVHEVEVVAGLEEVGLGLAVKVAVPAPAQPGSTISLMASTYSCSSFSGLVSSKRRWQTPP